MQQFQVADARGLPRMLTRGACRLCPEPATADSPWCSEHLADAVERERVRIAVAAHRKKKRSERRCRDCGKKCRMSRCRACHRKKRRGVTAGVTTTVPSALPPIVRRPDLAARTVAITYADGRTRNRYIGKGKRGHPSRADEDAWCLRTLRAEIELAAAAVDASHAPEVKDLPAIQRDAIVQDALSHLGLLERQLDELVDRLKRRLR